ncbi:MAG TPA: hypothetical protein PLT09_06605 [Deltaproteobacteria bacterium]|nr:hypothetical protein [Deltaproteobacteria bacterium]HPR54144.1 hypothetical protein [Deltaproteobacteria bacterium]HXK47092.1 hypothetical protein [Deltaproteobacteria bacterium]
MAEKKTAITPSNLAREWGVGLKAVKDAIVKAGIEPASTRGACRYYTEQDAKKIKSFVNKK